MSVKATAAKPLGSAKNLSSSPTGQVESVVRFNSPLNQVMYFHQTLGNREVQRLFKAGKLQAALKIGQPNDIYEQEADRVADQVMRMPTPLLSRKRGGCAKEEELNIRRKPESSVSDSSLPSNFMSSLGAGQPLDRTSRDYFETRFGMDFSHVRVHSGAGAAESAASINARAYALGNNVVFGAGQYQPNTIQGKRLLAHELTHVAQNDKSTTIRRAETEDRESICSGLTDIKSDVNSFVNTELSAARSSVGVSPFRPFFDEVADRTGGSGAVSPIETFIERLPSSKRFLPPASLSGTRYSGLPSATLSIPNVMGFNIYDLQRRGLAHVVGATAKINGFCVGADKLGHFFQQGAQYFQIATTPSLGGTAAAAESFGRSTEISRAGLGATGVYSNADLAANRDGLRFWQDLQATPGLTFDIARYISSNWNEYVNPNFYESSVASQVWAVQLSRHWSGSFGLGPALTQVDVNLTATPAGAVTGTFSYAGAAPGLTVTGTLTGTIIQNTTSVSGTSPMTVLHGGSGTVSATPVSSITINFDWTDSTSSGKGTWTSVSETRLEGTFGNGTSRTDRGLWWIIAA